MNPKNKVNQLTHEQKRYLNDRGFEIIHGLPMNEEEPYILLNEVNDMDTVWNISNPPINYRRNLPSGTVIGGYTDPNFSTTKELTYLIEDMVSQDYMRTSTIKNDKLNPSGQPIKVFTLDSQWDDITNTLVKDYPPQNRI